MGTTLQNNIHLNTIPVAEMMKYDGFVVPLRLTPHFLIHKRLQQLPQQGAVFDQGINVSP